MLELSFPVPTQTLSEYLPHREPMLWVNEVLSIHSAGGVCRAHFDASAHYCDEKSQLRPTAFIEWMAQSYGFVRACQVASGMATIAHIPKLVFLAQIRNGKIESTDLATSPYFDIEVRCLKTLGPLILIKGTVRDSRGLLRASADLKLFAE